MPSPPFFSISQTCQTCLYIPYFLDPSRCAVLTVFLAFNLAVVPLIPCLRTTWLVTHSPGIVFCLSHVCCRVILFYFQSLFFRNLRTAYLTFLPSFSCLWILFSPHFLGACVHILLDPLPTDDHSSSPVRPNASKFRPLTVEITLKCGSPSGLLSSPEFLPYYLLLSRFRFDLRTPVQVATFRSRSS